MNKKMLAVLGLAFSMGMMGCEKSSESEKPKFTEKQLAAMFYYDLGPEEIVVSSYPEKQKKNYSIFSRTCSQCHTLARPINVPLVEKKDWDRYINRMHQRTKVRAGAQIAKKDVQAILDFLIYDSRVRKVEGKASFDEKAAELKRLFEEVKKERERLQMEEGREKARPAPPYTGDKPNP